MKIFDCMLDFFGKQNRSIVNLMYNAGCILLLIVCISGCSSKEKYVLTKRAVTIKRIERIKADLLSLNGASMHKMDPQRFGSLLLIFRKLKPEKAALFVEPDSVDQGEMIHHED